MSEISGKEFNLRFKYPCKFLNEDKDLFFPLIYIADNDGEDDQNHNPQNTDYLFFLKIPDDAKVNFDSLYAYYSFFKTDKYEIIKTIKKEEVFLEDYFTEDEIKHTIQYVYLFISPIKYLRNKTKDIWKLLCMTFDDENIENKYKTFNFFKEIFYENPKILRKEQNKKYNKFQLHIDFVIKNDTNNILFIYSNKRSMFKKNLSYYVF
jgi:hypothetical protein